MSRYESIYPRKMKKGAALGVAAPSSPFDDGLFEKGLSILTSMGFKVEVTPGIRERDLFLAGTDEHRAALLNALFKDPDVNGIVCARGGYGAMRLLDRLDYRMIRENPKPLIGFSDVSALLSAVHSRSGLVCFHGPVVTSLSTSDVKTLKGFEDLLCGSGCSLKAENGRVVIPGRAEGLLKGGNLATLCHLTGTPYVPDFEGAILMLEDVGEAPYKIDRMLTQMKMAGLFNKIRGVVCGSFERSGDSVEIESVFKRTFQDLDVPLAMGFPFGHGSENLTWAYGGKAVFDTDSMTVVSL
jgi:muramoyltetrapeptide carboxypeptidase